MYHLVAIAFRVTEAATRFVKVITSSVAPAPPKPPATVIVCANAVPETIVMTRPLSAATGSASVASRAQDQGLSSFVPDCDERY